MTAAAVHKLAESDYEGWSVLLGDGTRLYESNPWNPKLLQPLLGSRLLPFRRADRATMDWKDLPHDGLVTLELYFARERYRNQPVVRIDRQPGLVHFRFIQYKMGGVVIPTHRSAGGPARTGIYGYRVGYWNKQLDQCELIEVTRDELKRLPMVKHPCWPTPHGYGLAPFVVGLREDEVEAFA